MKPVEGSCLQSWSSPQVEEPIKHIPSGDLDLDRIYAIFYVYSWGHVTLLYGDMYEYIFNYFYIHESSFDLASVACAEGYCSRDQNMYD